jgi:NAD(P)-dependent dehydrogenase (short-subunit alcohol dehydrogenase family)
VSKPDEIEALLDTARSRFGGLDIVVANAGLDEGLGPVLDITEAEYDRTFNVNAKGAFFTLQKAGGMVDSGGSIVYIGSSSTLRPTAGFGLYTSSKLPASFLVGVLAQEIGERGVAVCGSRNDCDRRRRLLHRKQGRRPAPSARTERQPHGDDPHAALFQPVPADSAADLLAISPRICGMTTAQAKSVGGFAEPAGEVVVQVLLIVADPGDMAVGA